MTLCAAVLGGDGLQEWAIALIVVGVLAALGLTGIAAFMLHKGRGKAYFNKYFGQTTDAAEAAQQKSAPMNAQMVTNGFGLP